MPLATHLPEADKGDVAVNDHPVTVLRLGGGAAGIVAPPSGDLLPSGGTPARVPVPAPTRALALDALRLLRRWADSEQRPVSWSEAAHRAEVDTILRQLGPIRTRRSLAASFAREASRMAPAADGRRIEGDDPGPLRLAYALRWLELGPTGVSSQRPRSTARG